MVKIIIGNIVALIGSILLVYSGLIKPKKKILYVQTIQIGVLVISNLILGGITGAIINTLSCIRNILCYKNKLGKKEKVIITILAIIFSVAFGNFTLIDMLPLISMVAYLWLMNVKDVVKFKILIIFNTVFWLIYDIYIKSYTSAVFDFLCIVANIVSIIQIKVKSNKNKKIMVK
jgi:hypothetical protein